jgi:opacity protein-like surface antigen
MRFSSKCNSQILSSSAPDLDSPASNPLAHSISFNVEGETTIVMQKIGLVVFTLVLFAGLASAQIPTSGNVFFGYSYYNTDLSSIDRANTNGWELSVEGKVIPWVGIVADFDGHYGSQNFPAACQVTPQGLICSSVNASVTEHNYLFGPRVSVSVGKFRPFAEALFGGAHVSINNGGGSDTSFATAVGGGIDYKIIRPVAWRLQGDYVQTRFFGTTQNNIRLSTGIVLRF